MPNFGSHTNRPGGEPPPRRQLSPEEIRIRETFNRAEHLRNEAAGAKGNGGSAPSGVENPRVESVFDEQSIRAMLNQLGLDFQIFPIGEKPADPGSKNQRIKELESERVIIRNRMLVAEQSAADAIREVQNITIERDTLRNELEALKSESVQQEAT